MKKIYRSLAVILTLLICFIFVPAALAHPLGNFTVNHYAGLQINPRTITIDYVMDLAEIPAFQEIELFDANGNGKPDTAEADGYHPVRCASLQPSLNLFLNQKAVPLSLASSSIEFPAGVGGLPTMRLTCTFEAPINVAEDSFALSFQNNVFADRLGWQEIILIPDGVTVQGEYSSTSPSNRLTNYPQDLLTSPLEQRQLEVEITSIGMPAQSGSPAPMQGSSPPSSARDDAFTRLILLDEITLPTLLLALAVSFIWGATHAMTPGHGKTIVGAYLVGSRGTLKHALYLGLTTTITHTLGVFALGLVTLFAAQYIVPETLYPWMSLLSGLFVVGIGLNLFVSRFKSSGNSLPKIKPEIAKSSFSPVFQHSHTEVSGRSHKYVLNASGSGEHLHDHGHPHAHSHEDHAHDHTQTGHHHDHGNGEPSHMPPEEITWRSLLALGVSGGLIPCPSALVVLLGAIALNKIGFGLILVLAFSLGLAATLTAIGILFIYAGRLFERFPSQGRLIRLLPVLSALFVSAVGMAIFIKALIQIGII
ncbi:MAG TPA: sulfite exporter TauE/SafE family protein [Anaerolineales bacterium]|nr:sulfite exporter TauE/SafE family protein [Anaerolineales bacterium]